MSDSTFRPSPDTIAKQLFFAIELFHCFAHYTCQVFVALCAEDPAAPIAPIWVHIVYGTEPLDLQGMRCVKHWCLQEAHNPMSPKRLKKKK